MRKGVTLYVIGALISYYCISGITFALFEQQFNDDAKWSALVHETPKDRSRKCLANLGVAFGWGALAAGVWPVFLPGLYFISGFAFDGIWTTYPVTRCRQFAADTGAT